MTAVVAGPGLCGELPEATRREWLVADGTGGYAMGTVAMLRTRRYHGLLVVATKPPIGRMLALVAIEPVLVVGGTRTPLGTFAWQGGAIDPTGHRLLASFALVDGVPTWRYVVGPVVLEMEIAALHGRPGVGVALTVLAAPGPLRLELGALCTWRDVHGERRAGADPAVEAVAGGFVFEGQYRVAGPQFHPGGAWYRGVVAAEEAARGLASVEDCWHAGAFVAELEAGATTGVVAWSGDLGAEPPPAAEIVRLARARARRVAAGFHADADRHLVLAADQFVTGSGREPTVVAGYPWFGEWSRDTMLSYEGLFLVTGRAEEGRSLLLAASRRVSDGMLANTADVGGVQYNSVDGTLWFIHAVGRHVETTDDDDLAAEMLPVLEQILAHYEIGTRFGIAVDPRDGLLAAGVDGLALTWMDAVVDGVAVTARRGKPVEVNALWINACAVVARLARRVGGDAARSDRLGAAARAGFRRFVRSDGRGLLDVVDPRTGTGAELRPNQLLACSLPDGPLAGDALAARTILAACGPLVTSLGLRSLAPDDPGYLGRHRGDQRARDHAYHEGTVWPWLVGPYVDVLCTASSPGRDVLAGLVAHLGEFGLGSVSETADGDAPHGATGCPFQAWSVAELLRARRRLEH